MTLTLQQGQKVERQRLLRALVELQYRRNELDFCRGAFRAKGDTIEIFPAHLEDRAWRLSMFGDEVESITEFDPLTGERTGQARADPALPEQPLRHAASRRCRRRSRASRRS